MTLLFFVLTAFAAEPQVDLDHDGQVIGTVVVTATEAQVRSVLDNAEMLGELSPQVIDVHATTLPDGCEELVTETKGMFRNLTYTSRRCRTAKGWDDTLVQSDDFSEYRASWEASPVDGGTRITVRSRTNVNLPLPDSLVNKQSRKGIAEMLEALVEKVSE